MTCIYDLLLNRTLYTLQTFASELQVFVKKGLILMVRVCNINDAVWIAVSLSLKLMMALHKLKGVYTSVFSLPINLQVTLGL